MDRLGMCMDELRVLARSNDPDRAVLVEAYSTPILLPRQSVCGGVRRRGAAAGIEAGQ